MYLADRDIRELLPVLRMEGERDGHPFDPDRQIQPCSIDLRVSSVFWKPSRRRRLWRRLLARRETAIDLRRSHVHDLDPRRDWKRVVLDEGDVLTIKPNQVVMARIYEKFQMPPDHAGKIEGRSSFSRLGLSVHCSGDFINPGWAGFMPLQLVNDGPYPIRITPYVPLCQLMLVRLSSRPERGYGDPGLQSKYVNDDGGPSLWWRDKQIRKLQERLGEIHATERMQQRIVAHVGFESAEVIERFQHHVDNTRLKNIENADGLLDAFAKSEDRRRLRDNLLIALPAIAAGGLLGSLFASLALWHVVVIALALVSLPLALSAWVRRDAGYLGTRELREARKRPDGESI
jgi:deoxycytidine triphosphate deaminase